MGQTSLNSMADYLVERQSLIAAREGFFQTLRVWLRPEQRIDAEVLGDRTARGVSRTILPSDWIANPARGYVTILESPERNRLFRFSVLQLGMTLKVGLRLPFDKSFLLKDLEATRLYTLFAETRPTVTTLKGLGDTFFIEWEFDSKNLYKDAQSYEEAVYRVAGIFEAALHQFNET